MELWRWAQSNAAVHFVSRKVPAAPARQHGGLILHDAVLARSFLRGRSEELVFLEDATLAQRLRRGLSFVELAGAAGPALVRRGLPKFFDLDVDALPATLCSSPPSPSAPATGLDHRVSAVGSSRTQAAFAAQLSSSMQSACRDGKAVTILKLNKANGENAQVSYFAPTHQWVVCSKNVSLLAQDMNEVSQPQWADHRYRFARQIAEVWFGQLGRLAAGSQADLRESLATNTLVGELIGSSSHLVRYGSEHDIRWFAVVPHGGHHPCWPPLQSHAFLTRSGLPAVPVEVVGSPLGYTSLGGLLEALRRCADGVEQSSISVEGEGCVVYFVAGSAATGNPQACETIGLGKLKTAEYRLMRKVREKAKHFARGAGSVLIEDVLAGYSADVHACRATSAAVQKYAELLERTCKLIYAEDLPAETVDETFLDVVARAQSFEGSDAPRPPAPVLCLVMPPKSASAQLTAQLRIAIDGDAAVDVGRASAHGLSAAWHRSAASRRAVLMGHVPSAWEVILRQSKGADVGAAVASERPAKRRQIATPEEKHAKSLKAIQEQLVRRRGLFVFWGWSDEGLAQCLDATCRDAHEMAAREAHYHVAGPGEQRALLKKWSRQAGRLSSWLPRVSSLWIPSAPAVGDTRSIASIRDRFESLRHGAGSNAAHGLVIVMLPIGVPGMGKTSLLEGFFSRCQANAGRSFRQGVLQPPARPQGAGGAPSDGVPELAVLSMLSSDGFAGAELQAAGWQPATCSAAEFDQARRRAAERYKREVDAFFRFVSVDVASQQHSGDATSRGVRVPRYLLILDKNHPPPSLRREVEQLRLATPVGCDVHIRSVVLTEEPSSLPRWHDFEEAEASEYGKWEYAWSLDALAECCARLLLRSSHETLASGETALFVLLSFFKLHRSVPKLGAVPGATVLEVPLMSLATPLASWTDLVPTGDQEEGVWRRFEVRALLREALLVLKPFGDEKASAPLVAALVKCLRASGLQAPHSVARTRHAERCAELLVASVAAIAPGDTAPPVAAVRYAAVSVEAHHARLEACLNAAQQRMAAGAGGAEPEDAYPTPPYRAPELLHITTLYVGGAAALPPESRELLIASRRLHAQGAAYECAVTHIVCARGALAVAVVDAERFRTSGIPMDQRRPHITLRTRPPWKPRHSNDVIEAAAPLLAGADCASLPLAPGSGAWLRAARVGNGVLDIFVFRLHTPLLLPQNPLCLL